MQHFYILNESSDKSAAGDVNFFSNVKSLVESIEAIDVENGEYFCFTSDGREVKLHASNASPTITVTTEVQPEHAREAQSILRSHLLWLAKNGKIKTSVNLIEIADLPSLADLVPRAFIR